MKLKLLLLVLTILFPFSVSAQNLDQFKYDGKVEVKDRIIKEFRNFNGYTGDWTDEYEKGYRYGGLFKKVIPDVMKMVLQNKVDIAEELGMAGLAMQEGFLSELLASDYTELEHPAFNELEPVAGSQNVLIYASPDSETGKKLLSLAGDVNSWKKKMTSSQYLSSDYAPVDAFILKNGETAIFAVVSSKKDEIKIFQTQLKNVKNMVSKYDFHKGWMGLSSGYRVIGTDFGHPLDYVGKALNEGNSWVVFAGYDDFFMKGDFKQWMDEVGNPLFVEFGSSSLSYISGARCFAFGLDSYDGLQEQNISLPEYAKFVKARNGYFFRKVFDPDLKGVFNFDGYYAGIGNKEQIDAENVPFVSLTGSYKNGLETSMILFLEKGKQLNRKTMADAILSRKAVTVVDGGNMMGPENYRNALQMLLLDRVYLDNYYKTELDIQAEVVGKELSVIITNFGENTISGDFSLEKNPNLNIDLKGTGRLTIPAKEKKELTFTIKVNKEAMGKTSPIVINFNYNGKQKTSLTKLVMPDALVAHQLYYGQAPEVDFPVSVHNFTDQSSFPVSIKVEDINKQNKVVCKEKKNLTIAPDEHGEMFFKLKLPPGDYNVITGALGIEKNTQLGVEKAEGKPIVYPIDLNTDGIDEYRLENEKVQVTLLTAGARVIEYYEKSKKDNVLFKLWPDVPFDDRKEFRKVRGFYPYGGFEDFLGGPSIETHKVYDAEILETPEGCVSVKMTAEYYGNTIEKIFTLYGNSPLIEIKYRIDFINPTLKMIGPQPIVLLGEEHGPEDVYYIPEKSGINEYRMKKEAYYGRVFHMAEGWNAGQETNDGISFVGAYPVDQPVFMHMYMNHVLNPASKYNYVEFQPWMYIYPGNTWYFSYYMWTSGEDWKKSVDELRKRNLITGTSR
ncbi:MAG: hypothetical protein MI975_15190 [Cytophagales bacterium]|nr:hypothetical protein [Cytophagales bacterium]